MFISFAKACRFPGLLGALLGLSLSLQAAEVELQAKQVAFFESSIRPLLVDKCYSCHSQAKGKAKGGLELDTRAAVLRGGDTGPALVPGKPEASLLIKAVRYTDSDLQMPPKNRLSADEVAALEEWVRMGAPDPRIGAETKSAALDLTKARQYWAFQPVQNPAPPAVKNARWAKSPLDRFVLARLEQEHLHPNPPADRRTLLRRLYFDLLGLPPSYEESEAFVADRLPNAVEKVVDRLLARPEYGQRWARHWLDVARYADTHDQSVDGERRYPFAFTYRDYVIDAFNADKPFDRFIVEQIAADLLPQADRSSLAALGFLNVGRRFLGNADAETLVIDDQIDAITRGFLGLTVACARCHDHKFDPIPTADYYSLFGIIASAETPLDLPEISRHGSDEAVQKYLAARSAIFREYEKHIDTCYTNANRQMRDLAGEYLEYEARSLPNHRTVEGFVPLDTPRGLLLPGGPERWHRLLEQSAREQEPFFALWRAFVALPRDGFAAAAKPLLAGLDTRQPAVHPWLIETLRQHPPASMVEVADVYGQVIHRALTNSTPEAASILDVVYGPKSPVPVPRQEMSDELSHALTDRKLTQRDESAAAGTLREKLTALEATSPVLRAMAVVKTRTPYQPHILIRGNAQQPGAPVPRRFLQILGQVDDREYHDDGRLELAQAIASPRNPLTARVIVNRVWQHHFGEGLVATPDNFGKMGAAPANPELLDHLATWFMEHGWSLKALHRYILLSATWQQSSHVQPAAFEKDPSDHWMWRMSPRRLEFEPLRDSLLAVSGRLDTRLGGPGESMTGASTRRAVYGQTDRFRIPALLRAFDVANPDTSISHRSETLVPQQALFLMNSPFVREQAAAVAHRAEVTESTKTAQRIDALYRVTLSRRPERDEARWARAYVESVPAGPERDQLWIDLAQTLLLSNEFVFVP